MSGHEADVPEMTPMVPFQVYLKYRPQAAISG
jgi:hypothetical protein